MDKLTELQRARAIERLENALQLLRNREDTRAKTVAWWAYKLLKDALGEETPPF